MLKLGGYINLLISLLHFGALFCLDDAFRLTGVTEQMQYYSQIWTHLPLVMTIFVAVVFALFGIYALSAAGVLKWKPPLMKFGIYAIATVYIIRGITGMIMTYTSEISDFLQALFALAALGIGCLYLIGGWVAFTHK